MFTGKSIQLLAAFVVMQRPPGRRRPRASSTISPTTGATRTIPTAPGRCTKRRASFSRRFKPTGTATEPISRRGRMRRAPILFHRIRSPRCGPRPSATSARYPAATYSGFVDAGTVFMHSAEDFRTGTDFSSLVWTSPHAGLVHIDGGLWISKAFDRPHQWELRKNGVGFTSGGLSLERSLRQNQSLLVRRGFRRRVGR